jgi:hypothetical protein
MNKWFVEAQSRESLDSSEATMELANLTNSETPVLRPRPFSDPYLSMSVELTTAAMPSFLTFILCASTLRRQAVFLALAALTREGPESLARRLRPLAPADIDPCNAQTQIAAGLMSAPRACDIVEAVYSEVPDGLLGVLKRIGDDPLPSPDLYFRLFETFSNPSHRTRAAVLRHCSGSIRAIQVEAIRRLDPLLVHNNILKRLHRVSQADDANAALALVRGTVSSATEEVIRQSVENLGDKTDLATFFSRWLAKMDRPPACPLVPENDPDIAVMTSGEEMASLGRRTRRALSPNVAVSPMTTGL